MIRKVVKFRPTFYRGENWMQRVAVYHHGARRPEYETRLVKEAEALRWYEENRVATPNPAPVPALMTSWLGTWGSIGD